MRVCPLVPLLLLSCLAVVPASVAREGDLDHDCAVAAADLERAVEEALELAPRTGAADATADGRVSVADAVLVARFLTGAAVPGLTPSIASFEPLTAAPGEILTITGCDFDAVAALANRVRVGGMTACVVTASATSLTVQVPSSPSSGPIEVGTSEGSGRSDASFVAMPMPELAVESVTPASGEAWGGTRLVIRGQGFEPGVKIDVGGAPTSRPRLVHPWELHVDTPPHAEGPVDVVVTNPGAPPMTIAGAFTYVASPAPAAEAGFVYTMAGNGWPGYGGEGFQARETPLYWPDQIEFDWEGRLVIVDWNNHRVRRVNADGVLEQLIGYKHGDSAGPRMLTALNHPTDVTFDDFGNMYLAAWHNHKIKGLDFAAGQVVNWAGDDQGYAGDGQPIEGVLFNLPVSLAWMPGGEMVLCDSANQRIRLIDLQGNLRAIAGTGVPGFSGDGGPAIDAMIKVPIGDDQDPGGRVSADRDGNIYFTDSLNHRIRRIDTDGIITTIAGTGTRGWSGDGGPATAAELDHPSGLAVAPDGTIFVSEQGSHVVRRIDRDGTITTIAGNGAPGFAGDRARASLAQFNKPNGLALDRWGNLYVCDKLNNRIRVITSALVGPLVVPPDPVVVPPVGGLPPTSGPTGVIDTYAGSGVNAFNGDGLGALATELYWPHHVHVEPWSQLVYIIDWNNHRIRRVEANGTVTTVAGTGDLGDDYGPASEVRFNHPSDLVFDPTSNDIIIDAWHNDKIKRLVSSSQEVVPHAGVARGFSGDGGQAVSARLNVPAGIELDAQGRLWIGDQGNQCVRRINLDGTIETVIGTPRMAGFSGDGGPARQAKLFTADVSVPDVGARICFDPDGNFYIADTYNNRIRRVDADTDVITTYAGNGASSSSGDGGQAAEAGVHHPVDVVFGPDGNLYIAEREAHRIRRVETSTGIITTFAGNGNGEFSGDGGPAAEAALFRPSGMNFNAAGDLYIADTGNARIRVIWH